MADRIIICTPAIHGRSFLRRHFIPCRRPFPSSRSAYNKPGRSNRPEVRSTLPRIRDAPSRSPYDVHREGQWSETMGYAGKIQIPPRYELPALISVNRSSIRWTGRQRNSSTPSLFSIPPSLAAGQSSAPINSSAIYKAKHSLKNMLGAEISSSRNIMTIYREARLCLLLTSPCRTFHFSGIISSLTGA